MEHHLVAQYNFLLVLLNSNRHKIYLSTSQWAKQLLQNFQKCSRQSWADRRLLLSVHVCVLRVRVKNVISRTESGEVLWRELMDGLYWTGWNLPDSSNSSVTKNTKICPCIWLIKTALLKIFIIIPVFSAPFLCLKFFHQFQAKNIFKNFQK